MRIVLTPGPAWGLVPILATGCFGGDPDTGSEPACPQPTILEVDADDDALGFSAQDVVAAANEAGDASLTWEYGGTTDLTVTYVHDEGLVEITDPNFDPTYPDAKTEEYCELVGESGWLRAEVDLGLSTADGDLNVVIPATLLANRRAGEPELAELAAEPIDVDMLGDGYTPPPEFVADPFDQVLLEAEGWFGDPRPLVIDEATMTDDVHGAVWGRAVKAEPPADKSCEVCSFLVGVWRWN